MRRALLLVLVLPACADSSGPARIECRTSEDAAFERVCLLERRADGQDGAMIVRRPDGGFRRLVHTGAAVDAADGAEQPRVTRLGDGRLEVDFGADAYRVPE